jgi:hypothetical protein
MVEIMSRFELRNWLRKKPRSWSQVMAARAALQVIPYAFNRRMQKKWYKSNALVLLRSSILSWTIVNARNSNVDLIYNIKKISDACDNSSISAEAFGQNNVSYAFDTSSNAIRTASGITHSIRASDALADAALATFNDANRICVWRNCSCDCDWLSSQSDADLAAYTLTRVPLWSVSEPDDWQQTWRYAEALLSNLDPTYQVWIDWYNRRIEGHEAAFYIPGDIDRVHDKAILARLADATDQDFWGKGATYVNTTLQGWIDEARLTAELESIVRRLEAGAATQFGSLQARETLAAFRAKLEAALGNQPPAHAPIGHNHPPEGIDPAEVPILPPALREEARAMLVTLDQPTPNSLDVAKTLTRWSRLNSTFQHDEFSKNFSGELGTSAARGIVLILTTLCLLGLAWLKAVLGI